jgi:hypothetical protein
VAPNQSSRITIEEKGISTKKRIMDLPPVDKSDPCPAPCQGARYLLGIAITLTVLIGLAISADRLRRMPSHQETTTAWVAALPLSGPAWWPAGSPMRHPEMVHPGVDLRFSPGLVIVP